MTPGDAKVTALIDACIDVAVDQGWFRDLLVHGKRYVDEIYEPWPAMDAMLEAVDALRPDWRTDALKRVQGS